jgi:hypothetical protein
MRISSIGPNVDDGPVTPVAWHPTQVTVNRDPCRKMADPSQGIACVARVMQLGKNLSSLGRVRGDDDGIERL